MRGPKVVGRLENVKRLNSSSMGNPRFVLTIDAVRYQTQDNAAVGYDVENHKVGQRVELTLSRAGRVIDMVRVES
jgi:hypothetical protein